MIDLDEIEARALRLFGTATLALVAEVRSARAEVSSHRYAALMAAGIHGGPHAWRWASDPTGTILGDAEAWERLLGEMREYAGARARWEAATRVRNQPNNVTSPEPTVHVPAGDVCPLCGGPVIGVPVTAKPNAEAVLAHYDCQAPARGASWVLA